MTDIIYHEQPIRPRDFQVVLDMFDYYNQTGKTPIRKQSTEIMDLRENIQDYLFWTAGDANPMVPSDQVLLELAEQFGPAEANCPVLPGRDHFPVRLRTYHRGTRLQPVAQRELDVMRWFARQPVDPATGAALPDLTELPELSRLAKRRRRQAPFTTGLHLVAEQIIDAAYGPDWDAVPVQQLWLSRLTATLKKPGLALTTSGLTWPDQLPALRLMLEQARAAWAGLACSPYTQTTDRERLAISRLLQEGEPLREQLDTLVPGWDMPGHQLDPDSELGALVDYLTSCRQAPSEKIEPSIWYFRPRSPEEAAASSTEKHYASISRVTDMLTDPLAHDIAPHQALAARRELPELVTDPRAPGPEQLTPAVRQALLDGSYRLVESAVNMPIGRADTATASRLAAHTAKLTLVFDSTGQIPLHDYARRDQMLGSLSGAALLARRPVERDLTSPVTLEQLRAVARVLHEEILLPLRSWREDLYIASVLAAGSSATARAPYRSVKPGSVAVTRPVDTGAYSISFGPEFNLSLTGLTLGEQDEQAEPAVLSFTAPDPELPQQNFGINSVDLLALRTACGHITVAARNLASSQQIQP